MIKSYNDFIGEGLNNKQLKLKELFIKSITKVDEDLSVKDFAAVVAEIFYEEYGQHNYATFINIWNNVKSMQIDDLEED